MAARIPPLSSPKTAPPGKMLYIDTAYLFRVYSTKTVRGEIKALPMQTKQLASHAMDFSCSSCRLYALPNPATLGL